MPGVAKSPLSVLVAAAASLIGPAAQAAIAEQASASYRFTEYDEEGLPASEVGSGDGERYRVLAHQVQIVKPVDEEHQLDIRVTQEAMSGSSPWFVLPDAEGDPIQVLSGATIEDTRRELAATLRREPEPGSAWIAASSWSVEDDYHAVALGLERERELDPQKTLSYGMSFSRDVLEPTDAELFNRVQRETKHTVSGAASVTFVLDKVSTLQAGAQLTAARGYLDDPYKLAVVDNALLPDTRPDRRNTVAWIARWRRAFPGADASLHLDYRYAHDSWSIRAHTVDVAWFQHLPGDWWLIPALRYHGQSEARFYAPVHVDTPADGDHSSDYRLGQFGSWSARLGLRKRLGDWTLALGVERYDSDEDSAPGGAEQAVPGLVEFTRAYVGIDYAF